MKEGEKKGEKDREKGEKGRERERKERKRQEAMPSSKSRPDLHTHSIPSEAGSLVQLAQQGCTTLTRFRPFFLLTRFPGSICHLETLLLWKWFWGWYSKDWDSLKDLEEISDWSKGDITQISLRMYSRCTKTHYQILWKSWCRWPLLPLFPPLTTLILIMNWPQLWAPDMIINYQCLARWGGSNSSTTALCRVKVESLRSVRTHQLSSVIWDGARSLTHDSDPVWRDLSKY